MTEFKKYLTEGNINVARRCLPPILLGAGLAAVMFPVSLAAAPFIAGLGGIGMVGNLAVATVEEATTSRELVIQAKNQLTVDLGVEALQEQNERLLRENYLLVVELEEVKEASKKRILEGEVIRDDEYTVQVNPLNTVLTSYKEERDALAAEVEALKSRAEKAEAEALLASCSMTSDDTLNDMVRDRGSEEEDDYEIKPRLNKAAANNERRESFLGLYPEFRVEDVVRELRLSTVGARDLISTWLRDARVIPAQNGRYAITGR